MKLNPCCECGSEIVIKSGHWLGWWWECAECNYYDQGESNSEENAIKSANKCNPLEADDGKQTEGK